MREDNPGQEAAEAALAATATGGHAAAVINAASENPNTGAPVITSAVQAALVTATAQDTTDAVNFAATHAVTLLVPSKPVVPRKPEIIGVADPHIHQWHVKQSTGLDDSDNPLTETLDTTTYPDRATLKLYNGLGYDVYLTGLQLNAKRIMKYFGLKDGLIHDKLKRDDDIRRNGEIVKTIANDYIVTGTQIDKIADYWFKYTTPKHVYTVTIKGTAPWYSLGEWYTLSLGTADTNEYISSTVECYSVEVERVCGSIGSTTIMFREVLENWTKTTLYAARAMLGGSPKRKAKRSNNITVASKDYQGTYDFLCDGTADEVQIQAAIDYVYNTFGGGIVNLTAGIYTLADKLTMRSRVRLIGNGANTTLFPASASVTTMIDFGSAVDAIIDSFVLDGNGGAITFLTSLSPVIDGQGLGNANNIVIYNYAFSNTSGSKYFPLFYDLASCNKCSASTNTAANTGTYAILYGFYLCNKMSDCKAASNSTTGDDADLFVLHTCNQVSNCYCNDNSTAGGDSNLYVYYTCNSVSGCWSQGNSTSGASSDLLSFYVGNGVASCTCASNSTSGAASHCHGFHTIGGVSSSIVSADAATGDGSHVKSFMGNEDITACVSTINTAALGNVYGFITNLRLSVCSTYNNSAATVTDNEYGFYDCKSVTHCKSSGDSVPYSISYADAGTSNACADTAAGGYNA